MKYLAEMISVRYMNSDMIPPCLSIPTFIGGNIGGTRGSRGSRKGDGRWAKGIKPSINIHVTNGKPKYVVF